MRRLHYIDVRLPVLSPDSNLAGLEWERAFEGDLRAFDYGRRSAIPLLDDYALNPFGGALKEAAFEAAAKEVGLTEEGLLKDRHAHTMRIGDLNISVSCYPVSAVSYEDVLGRIDSYLNGITADSNRRIKKTGVRKIGMTAYVSVKDVIQEAERLKSLPEYVTRFNKRDISRFRDLDEMIEILRIYLNTEGIRDLNPSNSQAYHQASSLKGRITGVMDEFKKRQMGRMGVTDSSDKREDNFELGDGTGARLLFYPQRSTEYGEAFKGLVGKETKNIAPSTGDLRILDELAFKEEFHRIAGKTQIAVQTQSEENGTGIVLISRTSEIASERAEYPVFRSGDAGDDRTFVKAETVRETLQKLIRTKTKTRTEMKVDFFPKLPDYK